MVSYVNIKSDADLGQKFCNKLDKELKLQDSEENYNLKKLIQVIYFYFKKVN